MADKKIQLKRNNASTIDNLFPVVRITDAVGSDGTTSFLDGGKIRSSYLPSYVIGGMKFFGVADLSAGTTEANAVAVETLGFSGAGFSTIVNATNFSTTADTFMGNYVVVNVAGWVKGTDGNTTTPVAYYRFGAKNVDNTPPYTAEIGEEGDNTSPIFLERGDWIVLTGRSSPATNAFYYHFGIVNNTYADATSTVKGVVTISNATDTSAMNGSGKVITEDVLFDVIGTAANKIAAGNHLHTGVYEPANAALTNLGATMASLSTGTLVKTGVDTFGLNTDTYLSDSTSSTQNGYFGNIHLRDDATPSHYLAITASSNLTANRTLSLATGDAARTLTFGGDITTTAGNLTVNAQAAGSTLSLPSTLTIGSVTANGILYGSSADNVGMIASTTIGRNTLTIPDIAAISFARYNADETISMLDAATFRTAIGAGTSSTTGTVTSVATSGAITGGTITTTGTISHSTADGFLHVPTTSTTNDRKFLVAGSTAGSFAWEAFPRTFYDTTAGTISGDIIFDEVV